jgi:hypothetical protein
MKKLLFASCNEMGLPERKNPTCMVLSHNTQIDRHGCVSYYSVLRCDDGRLISQNGLEWYVLPIGAKSNQFTYE